jgi:serpin B
MILAALMAVLLLAGCAAGSFAGLTGDLMAGIRAADWPNPPDDMDEALRSSVLNFSWTMLKASAANEGNVLISPASIYLALAMAMNGARADTLQAMRDTLAAEGMTEEEFDAACRDWISMLRVQSDKTELAVANSVWFRQGYDVAKGFLQTNADYFDAAARALDFDAPEAVDTINAWVEEQTRGVIDRIVEEISPNVMMYLINAVYFKSDWQTPFEAAHTFDGSFAAPGGEVTVPFMHSEREISYAELNGAQGVLLPYDDGRFSFFAVLPPQDTSVRDYISGMDGAGIAALLAAMGTGNVSLTLPKFETSYEDRLINELSAMGMGVAFSQDADFSGMNSQGASDLYISDVVHKTYCRVDELGTEAAAVTSVEMEAKGMPIFDAEIRFDRPFVYGIVDTASGAPLFLGVMEDPSR